MSDDSYSDGLSGILKDARDAPLPEPPAEEADDAHLRMAAIAAVLSMLVAGDDRAMSGRQPGSAWQADHRRTRMGQTPVMTARAQRTVWR